MKQHRPLTTREERAYQFILERVLETGNCPTLEEIRIEMGCSSCNSAVLYVAALRRKGKLRPASEYKSRIQLPPGVVVAAARALLLDSSSSTIPHAQETRHGSR